MYIICTNKGCGRVIYNVNALPLYDEIGLIISDLSKPLTAKAMLKMLNSKRSGKELTHLIQKIGITHKGYSYLLKYPIGGADRIIVCPQCGIELFVNCNSRNYKIVEINDIIMSRYLVEKERAVKRKK